ncbi:MAG: hypothetical protein WB626_06395 [Bacteroidota bacterium]
MKPDQIMQELAQVAQQMGVRIRYDLGDFEGGYCVLKAERVVLINRRLLPARKASVMALALHAIGLDGVFLKPALREYVEDEAARAGLSPGRKTSP